MHWWICPCLGFKSRSSALTSTEFLFPQSSVAALESAADSTAGLQKGLTEQLWLITFFCRCTHYLENWQRYLVFHPIPFSGWNSVCLRSRSLDLEDCPTVRWSIWAASWLPLSPGAAPAPPQAEKHRFRPAHSFHFSPHQHRSRRRLYAYQQFHRSLIFFLSSIICLSIYCLDDRTQHNGSYSDPDRGVHLAHR